MRVYASRIGYRGHKVFPVCPPVYAPAYKKMCLFEARNFNLGHNFVNKRNRELIYSYKPFQY